MQAAHLRPRHPVAGTDLLHRGSMGFPRSRLPKGAVGQDAFAGDFGAQQEPTSRHARAISLMVECPLGW
eukprot:736683-Alexandrium_andersonii.AAC.1